MLNKFNCRNISILPSSEVEIIAGPYTGSQDQDVVKRADETVQLVDPCPNDDRLPTVIVFHET